MLITESISNFFLRLQSEEDALDIPLNKEIVAFSLITSTAIAILLNRYFFRSSPNKAAHSLQDRISQAGSLAILPKHLTNLASQLIEMSNHRHFTLDHIIQTAGADWDAICYYLLSNIEKLQIRGDDGLKKALSYLPLMPIIKEISLSECSDISILPHSLNLNRLTFTDCPFTTLPAISGVRSLSIHFCPNLETLPSRLDLQELWLYSTPLIHLPIIPGLQSLKIIGANNIVNLPYIPSLISLTVVNCPNLKNLSSTPNLKFLKISNCDKLESLPPLSSYESIEIVNCIGLTKEGIPDEIRENMEGGAWERYTTQLEKGYTAILKIEPLGPFIKPAIDSQ